ncbi:AAA family ATPase [Streptomyces sp. NPDC005529]|uniref:helix-turn-helix transcriptional regulator n=1 Tax=unclassified Streptomyces TaxID=2593676 RepID=UPI0033B5845E
MAGGEASTTATGPAPGDGGFVGRSAQLEQLRKCADEARQGVPWVAAVEGEAGIGKTTLLRHFLDQLEDFHVVWASCDPTEQDLMFGAVDQLIRKLSRQASMEPSVRNADAAALSPLQAGAELLRMLTDAQAAHPLVVAIDDAHWSDVASATALSYVARRLWTQRILILLTARNDYEALREEQREPWWQRLTASTEHGLQIPVKGLGEAETRQMVQTSGLGPLPPAAVRRLVTSTGGHPLHLRSLITEIPDHDLADIHRPLTTPKTLAATTRQAVDRLTLESRTFVEALAVLGTAVTLPLAAQVADVTSPVDALEPALHAGLVLWWPQESPPRVRIKHALQQDAIYHMIPPSRLRTLHATAASLIDTDAAWTHRVAAAEHTDTALVAELHTEADRLASTGRLSRSATLLLWASDLSANRQTHEEHLLHATIRLLLAHDYDRCLTLTDAVRSCAGSALRTCVLGGLAYARADFAEAQAHLSELTEVPDLQAPPDLTALACLWLGAVHTRRHHGEDALPLLLRAAGLDLPQPRAVNYARHLLALASDALAGTQPHAPPPQPADAAPETSARTTQAVSLLLNPRGIVRQMAHELHAGMENFRTLVRRQRIGELQDIHNSEYFILAAFQYLSGAWDDALLTAQHGLALAASSGALFDFAAGHATAAMAASNQGRWDVALDQLEASEQAAERTRLPHDQIFPLLARIIYGQALGDPHIMHQALSRLPAPDSNWLSWWLPLQVETYTGTGHLNEATDALSHLDTLAEDVPALKVTACWLAGDLAMARDDSRTAAAAYRSGLAQPPDTDEIPLHRARLEHAYARLLLPTDPRTAVHHFDRSQQAYQAIGATPFADRAASESSNTPDKPPPPPVTDPVTDTLAALTPRERATALLVAEGMTNQEVAKRLYISSKTVEYHLRNIFNKLGLTSRRQLRNITKPTNKT